MLTNNVVSFEQPGPDPNMKYEAPSENVIARFVGYRNKLFMMLCEFESRGMSDTSCSVTSLQWF